MGVKPGHVTKRSEI